MVLLSHHRLVYIKSQELHELAWLLWRRAFFQGVVGFLNMLPIGHFFWYVQDLLRMSEKIDHLVDSLGMFSFKITDGTDFILLYPLLFVRGVSGTMFTNLHP